MQGRWRKTGRALEAVLSSRGLGVCLSLSAVGTVCWAREEHLPTHQGQPGTGGEHTSGVGSALVPKSLVLPLAARWLVSRDRDQELGLPEFGFLLFGLEELVLAKV